MGKGCGSAFNQNSPWTLPDLNFTTTPPDPGHHSLEPMMCPSYMNPYPSLVHPSSTVPGFAVTEASPQLELIRRIEPNSWYSCYNLPPFAMISNSFLEERFTATPFDFDLQYKKSDLPAPNQSFPTTQKRFLVLDQSGNHRSWIFSTIHTSPQFPNLANHKQNDVDGLHQEFQFTKDPMNHQTMPITTHGLEPKASWDVGLKETEVLGGNGGEMHEDTEDLEALLSSVYEEDEEEEESTGHSPCDIMGQERKEEEEVTSSVPSKRRRFEENGVGGGGGAEEVVCEMSLMDTASSAKGHGCWDHFHEAESSSRKSSNHRRVFRREASAKRSRREKIKKTVSILRSIIPGGKGKDAALVLEEAIRYLRSLRLKAKVIGANRL